MKSACTLSLLLLLVSHSVSAQVLGWRDEMVVEGLAGLDVGTADQRTSRDAVLGIDGKTWVAGRKDDPGEDDFFIARFDAAGQREFMHVIDLGGAESGGALLAADDGGVYASAGSRTVGGPTSLKLMRFDADGQLLWTRSIQGIDGQASSRTTLARHGSQVYLAYSILDPNPPNDHSFEIAQTIDLGTSWQAGWQASYLVPDGNFDQVNLSIRPDGQRLAFSTLMWGSPLRHYLVLVNAANGAVAGSHEGTTALRRVLKAAFASDGSIRMATRTSATGAGSEDEIQLLRFSGTAALQGSTAFTCADNCRIDALVVTSDDASFVLGGETDGTDPEQVLAVRFDQAGVFSWARRFTVATRGNAVDAVGRDTGVVFGIDAVLEDTGGNVRYQGVGRLDAAGDLTGEGIVSSESDNSTLVALDVDASGIAHLAGSDSRSIGRVIVSQYLPGDPDVSFLVDHGPAPTAVEVRTIGSLVLDPSELPVTAFSIEFFQENRVGLRALDAAGNQRWQVTSDGVAGERDSVVAATGSNELVWASRVGFGAGAQLGVRRIAADTGVATQLPLFLAENSPQNVKTAGTTDGTALVGASVGVPNGIVLRLFAANGQPQWRTQVGDDDSRDLVDVGFLANGDPVSVYQARPGFLGTDIHVQRYDLATGAAGTELTRIDPDFSERVERIVIKGDRVYTVGSRESHGSGGTDRQMQVLCFDFATQAECWPGVLQAGTGAGFGIVVDVATDRVYAAGQMDNGSGSEAVLLAIDDVDGSVAWQQTLSGFAGRDVFVRNGEAVLVAERLNTTNGAGDAVGLAGFTPGGNPAFQRTLVSGQRLEPIAGRYDADSDQLYLLAESARSGQLFTPTVLGIPMVTPDLIFFDRFQQAD